jgi:hypothetical protein
VKTYTIVPTIVPDFLSRTTLIHIILVSESAFLVFIDTTLVLLLGFILTVSGYLSTSIQNFVDPLELLFCHKIGDHTDRVRSCMSMTEASTEG